MERERLVRIREKKMKARWIFTTCYLLVVAALVAITISAIGFCETTDAGWLIGATVAAVVIGICVRLIEALIERMVKI